MVGTSLPKLPGYTVGDTSLDRTNFGLPQTLRVLKGYGAVEGVPATIVDAPKNGDVPPEVTLRMTTGKLTVPAAPQPSSTLPKFVAWDRKVLRFEGFFKEGVVESNVENHRIRRIILLYYLEDDTLYISEPKKDNSGIPQGVFVKRHRAKKPSTDGADYYYTPLDFSVGGKVDLYGRTFYLVDCDEFTRGFYSENGMEQSAGTSFPDDPLDAYRDKFKKKTFAPPKPSLDALTRFTEAKLGRSLSTLMPSTLRKFIDDRGKVLRFYCVWDDLDSLYGDYRPYILHCYLEDHMVEILEVREPNGGRDPYPKLLARAPLPKVVRAKNMDMTRPDMTLLVSTSVASDALYGPRDFKIGEYINVYGRDFLLYDADAFTKTWYKENMGMTDADLKGLNVVDPEPVLPMRPVPPYNGYGTLEDSIQNCVSLIPKPPKGDFIKRMLKDRKILRYVVKMAPGDGYLLSAADVDRKFILSYYLGNDELAIYEPPVRNSGIMGGKYLERQKVYQTGTQTPFVESDFYVGAIINVFKKNFKVVEGDEYTMAYMERHPQVWGMADISAIVKRVKDQITKDNSLEKLRSAMIEADGNGSGTVDAKTTRAVFESLGVSLSKHELLTLFRAVGDIVNNEVSIVRILERVS